MRITRLNKPDTRHAIRAAQWVARVIKTKSLGLDRAVQGSHMSESFEALVLEHWRKLTVKLPTNGDTQ